MIRQHFLIIDDTKVFLLGYPLALSPKERQILTAICTLPCPSPDLVAKEAGGISRSCLSVHICSINKKARAISGRHLVEAPDGLYRLNPVM